MVTLIPRHEQIRKTESAAHHGSPSSERSTSTYTAMETESNSSSTHSEYSTGPPPSSTASSSTVTSNPYTGVLQQHNLNASQTVSQE